MEQERFDSWDEFDTVKKVSVKEEVPVEEPPKRKGGRKKKQVETPVEITEEVEPVEENTNKEV